MREELQKEISFRVYRIEDKFKRLMLRVNSEKRKIKFREEFILKCKKAYNSLLAKHYVKKEASLLKEQVDMDQEDFNSLYSDDLDIAREKKKNSFENINAYQERLDEIQKIKDINAVEKAKEKYDNAYEKLGEVTTERNFEKALKAEDKFTRLNKKVSDTYDTEYQVEAKDTKEITSENQTVVEPETTTEVTPLDPAVQANLAQTVQEIGLAQAVQELEQENISSENIEPEINTVEPPMVSDVVESKGAEAEVDVVKLFEQKKAEQDVQNLHNKFANLDESFTSDIMNVIKNYAQNIQATAIETVASKQNQINALDNENTQLKSSLNERDNTIAELNTANREKDTKIGQLETSNAQKDNQISQLQNINTQNEEQIRNLTSENASKTAEIQKLQNEMKIMSEQFKQMQAMFNNFQTMMNNTMQPVSEQLSQTNDEGGRTLQKS